MFETVQKNVVCIYAYMGKNKIDSDSDSSAYHLIYGGMKLNALKYLSLTLSLSKCILYFAILFVSLP